MGRFFLTEVKVIGLELVRFGVFIVIFKEKSFSYVYLREPYWNEMDRNETYLREINSFFCGMRAVQLEEVSLTGDTVK